SRAPERMEGVVKPAHQPSLYVIRLGQMVIAGVHEPLDDSPESDVARGIVLDVLPPVPPGEVVRGVGQLCRLTHIRGVLLVLRPGGTRTGPHLSFGTTFPCPVRRVPLR